MIILLVPWFYTAPCSEAEGLGRPNLAGEKRMKSVHAWFKDVRIASSLIISAVYFRTEYELR